MLPRHHQEAAPLSGRIAQHSLTKEKLAVAAMSYIRNNNVVFLDSSSCNAAVATQICSKKQNCSIVSNMPLIADIIADDCTCELALLGGKYDSRLGAIFGLTALQQLAKYSLDIAFIGVAGINITSNHLSNFSAEEGEMKRAIIKAAQKVAIIVEHEKFAIDGAYNFADLSVIDLLICDKLPDKNEMHVLQKRGIEVVCVN